MIKALEEIIQKQIRSRNTGDFKIPASYTHEVNQFI